MSKLEFLTRLEKLIIDKEYPRQAIMILLHKATEETFVSTLVFDKMLEYTQDIQFAKKVDYLYDFFNRGNNIFEEYMLLAIKEAKL